MQTFLKHHLKRIKATDFLFLLLLIPIVIFALFYFRREKEEVFIDLTYSRTNWNTYLEPPEYWKVDDINVGDAVYNGLGEEIATITDVEKNVWAGGTRTSIELQLKMKVIFDARTRKYVLDGIPLLIGQKMPVNLGNSKFEGEIKNIYKDENQRYDGYTKAKATLRLKYRFIEAWHAEALKNFEQRNSKGDVLVKVVSTNIQPSEIMVPTDDGQAVRSYHPFKKDVDLVVELPRVLCRENTCFYNNYNTFMIGSGFWADSGSVNISDASVVDVQIEESNW